MTVTLTRKASRYSWVPAAAGWTVGVIATLSLIASVSPGIRWLIKEPREFVNDYIFNFPDTSFAWAFVLALLAAALAARKRIAWWILVLYMVAAIGWNIVDIAARGETWMRETGEMIGLGFHVAAIVFLLLGPQAVLGEGAPRSAAQGRRHAGYQHVGRHAHRVGSARALPRLAGP